MQTGNGASDPQNLTKALVVPDPVFSEPRKYTVHAKYKPETSLTKVQIHYIVYHSHNILIS